MATEIIRIRYDGPALTGHSMDVNHLAPALLAIGDLCTLANRKFNEDRASLQVMVRADLENNCFEFGIELVQTIIEQVKTFIKHDEIKDAKEIAEWIGLIAAPGITIYGLLKFTKWAKGKKITSKTIKKEAGRDAVQITVEGSNNSVVVYPQTVELYDESESLPRIKQLVQPLLEEGYDSIEFEHNKKVSEKISKDDAQEIMDIEPDVIKEVESEEGSDVITAWVKVYSPVYDSKAPMWRFKFGERTEYMNISETDIAEQAIKRGGAFINDMYQVKLEIKQTTTPGGDIKNHYTIKKVLDFKPTKPAQQQDMFKDEP